MGLTSPPQLYQLAIAQLRASTFCDRKKWTRPLILVKSSPQAGIAISSNKTL
ncbi:hypothetical protein KBT16_04360 [Nostoc sp. CCCryo 231-06]|nr:hypothetical protein [Nostoc sp. CCCryo 231-06]